MLLKRLYSFVIGVLLGNTLTLLGTFYPTVIEIVKSKNCPFLQTNLINKKTLLKNNSNLQSFIPAYKVTPNNRHQNVRVLCWILTKPINWKRANKINNTWAHKCDKTIFINSSQHLSNTWLNTIDEGRLSLYEKTLKGFQYIWKHHKNDADWFMKAEENSYVIVENLRYLLHNYDPDEPLYFGRKFKPHVKQGYMSKEAGYVLSKEALRRFNRALRDGKCPRESISLEGVEVGKCLSSLGVKAMDSRDSHLKETFFPLSPRGHLTFKDIPSDSWFWNYTYYPNQNGPECCSDFAISFHSVDVELMHVLDYFIYHLKLVGNENKYN